MTTLLPLRAIAACIALAAISLSAGDTFVRIDKEGGSRLNETLWKAEWGSYQKAKEEVRSFSARIRNNTKSTRTYVLEWYFIADNPLSKERSVASWGTLVKELAPGEEAEYCIVSDKIVGLDENYKALGERYYTGGRYDGYLVIVREGEKYIKKTTSKGSSSQFLKRAMALAREVNPNIPKD